MDLVKVGSKKTYKHLERDPDWSYDEKSYLLSSPALQVSALLTSYRFAVATRTLNPKP